MVGIIFSLHVIMFSFQDSQHVVPGAASCRFVLNRQKGDELSLSSRKP